MTDTQTLEGAISAPADFLPGFTPQAAPVQQTEKAPVAQTEAPKQEVPKTEPVKAEAPKAEAPKAEEAKAEPVADPYEAVFSDEAPAAPVEWDEKAKAAFKSVYGHDDPIAFKTEIDLLKAEVDKLLPLKQQIEALPPSLKRVLQMAQEGKANEAIDFLKGLPDGVFLDKEAKNIPSDKLIESYLPGKISKEDFAAVKDPDTDEDVKAAIELKIKHYREIAADMHERERQGVAAKLSEAENHQKALWKGYNTGVAKSLAALQNSNLKALVTPEFKEGFQSGQLMRSLFQEDGFTPTEDAAKRLLWAYHGEKLADAKAKVAYSKGKSEGLLEATSRQPGAPPINGRQTGGTPPDNSEQAVKESFLPGGKMFPMGT